MKWGSGWGGFWSTTDSVYGESPLDPVTRWNETMRPPLVNDPEIQVWRTVFAAAVGDLIASSWLVRWRVGSVMTALGVHLDALGLDLGLLRPDGWSDTRYRNVLIPIDGVTGTNRAPHHTEALAEGLVNGTQTWALDRPASLQYVVYFFELTENEALTYYDVLDRGRPHGVRLVLIYSPESEPGVFTLGTSALSGTDILALASFGP